MSRRGHEPLTAEERDLALRLSRLESSASPSASLDARILESARSGSQAAAPRPATPVRPHRRWPVAMGLAASLVVAVGVAWQLRPQPDSHVIDAPAETTARTGAAAPAAAVVAAPATDAAMPPNDGASPTTREDTDPVTAAPPPSPAPRPRRATAAPVPDRAHSTQAAQPVSDLARQDQAQAMRAREQDAQRAARSQAAQARQAAPVAPPPPAEPAVADAPSEALRLAPAAAARTPEFVLSPPPPPAPPAPPTVEAAHAPPAAPSPATLPEPAARAQAPSPALDRIEVSGSRVAEEVDVLADQPLDDRPPASADSPAIRERWLRRIRELRDAGRGDEARDSLREFVRRHPQAAIPADLRPMLDE